ncbi:DNA topoisomerase [Alkalithermobacter paradoxus]|uniref:DNA topoisomerase n=1 Tax=Alkalithermobacter paradoxus TaxID=29349 RepID=A0A1V4I712_9FIRM|nr:DNA topoisomerase 3 [[Clostridium] thermoalcaliphilum]
MSKALFITEKPSVAIEFAKALNIKGSKKNGYIESDKAIITWCVGHLVTMCYPEKYDPKYKKWSLKDLPFIPKQFKYEVIDSVKNQFQVIKDQMKREDVSTIYVCTDSGREGEYIYRLVEDMVGVKNKIRKRVWIDSQTEDEIRKGIKNAKLLSEYDNLSSAAYLRAKEDYLMGINFSRLLTLRYGSVISSYINSKYTVIAVGRVMTCVLGMIVQREREIREFVKTPYYKIIFDFQFNNSLDYDGEWKAVEGSKYHMSNLLFSDSGFKKKEYAQSFIDEITKENTTAVIKDIKKKQEKKNPPLLYNLAELQNECSKRLKLSPDETLKIAQELYEKKMITYPRTDARVLSTAVAKELIKNINGLSNMKSVCLLSKENGNIDYFINKIIAEKLFTNIEKTRYVNDKAITDHYAIIPTGQGLDNFNKLHDKSKAVYIMIVRRFLAIFYPPAIFSKLSITTSVGEENFFTTSKICVQYGYLDVLNENRSNSDSKTDKLEVLKKLKKNQEVNILKSRIKESETSPPKRYSSGSIILAMENAGKLIEDEELREEIKGSGIGTSATRAEILKKLEKIDYISLDTKTQILTPTPIGEMIYNVVKASIPTLLKPELTASWEKGLSMVCSGEINADEYMVKLESYIKKNVERVLTINNSASLISSFSLIPNSNK